MFMIVLTVIPQLQVRESVSSQRAKQDTEASPFVILVTAQYPEPGGMDGAADALYAALSGPSERWFKECQNARGRRDDERRRWTIRQVSGKCHAMLYAPLPPAPTEKITLMLLDSDRPSEGTRQKRIKFKVQVLCRGQALPVHECVVGVKTPVQVWPHPSETDM